MIFELIIISFLYLKQIEIEKRKIYKKVNGVEGVEVKRYDTIYFYII